MSDAIKMESETLGKLGEALAKAQAAMGAAVKSKVNPHFKSHYADLASVWEAIRGPLTDNGLCVVQRVTSSAQGVTVESTLLHTSGEFLRDRCWLPVQQQTPQAFGSAITYARRYSLSAVVGVAAEEDDDGNAASAPRVRQSPPPARTAPKARAAIQQAMGQVQQTLGNGEPPPHTDDDAPPMDEPGEALPVTAVVPIGRDKGKPVSEVDDKSIRWLANAMRENLEDAKKARWHNEHRQFLGALTLEAARRGLSI